MEYIHYKKIGDTRYLSGEEATIEECNEAYISGKLAETLYCKRLHKDVTIRGRSIMREEDYTDTVIDCFAGMESL